MIEPLESRLFFAAHPAPILHPYALTVERVSDGAAVLAWSDDARQPQSYVVERQTHGKQWIVIGREKGVETFSDQTIAPGNRYAYRVIATSARTASNEVGLEVLSPVPNLRATAVLDDNRYGVQLQWTVLPGVTNYQIERSADGGTTWTQVFSGTILPYPNASGTTDVAFDFPVPDGVSLLYQVTGNPAAN